MQKGCVSHFGLSFIFCRIKLNFGRLTYFDMESIDRSLIFLLMFASFSRNNVCQKHSVFLWRPFVEQKTKEKTFCFATETRASFISCIITLICYCCFISTSDLGAKRDRCEFALANTGSNIQGRSIFLVCSLLISKTKTSILKKMCCLSC